MEGPGPLTADNPTAQRLELHPLCLLTVLWISNSGWVGWVFLGQQVAVVGGSVGTDAGWGLGPSHHVASILGGQPGLLQVASSSKRECGTLATSLAGQSESEVS